MMNGTQRLTLGESQNRVADRLRNWQENEFARRLWEKDPTLWSSLPVAEITDRLGWLHLPEIMPAQVDELTAFAREVKTAGMRHVVLLGMGGSSLAPGVFQQTFGNAPGYPALMLLDSTHPAAVRRVASKVDLSRTLFVISSKSGTTTETVSLFQYFWQQVAGTSPQPGGQFVAITDPDTPLARLAVDRSFRRVWLAPPDVGGRYSALTVFGLVPAALIGVDVRRLLDRARAMALACGPSASAEGNPGLVLGAAIGELALAGRDRLTLVTSSSLASLPSWIEQLVAESTGKDGRGIVPVCDERLTPPEVCGDDRFFVYMRMRGDDTRGLGLGVEALEARGHPVARIELADPADLGGEFFRWEVAVAAAGAALGIHPFNQPDVQLAKDLAARAMASRGAADRRVAGVDASPQRVDEDMTEASVDDSGALLRRLEVWLTGVRPGDYLAVQAYLAPSPQTSSVLQEIRSTIGNRLRIATTSGYGPRFLHSTGQLHKGGPDTGVFLQLVDDPAGGGDLAVPETHYTFGALIRAQALGDFHALHQRGRRILRVHLGQEAGKGLKRLIQTLRHVKAGA